MHEIYFQIFRNVCIVFIYVCVCSYREKRDEGRKGSRNRDSKEMAKWFKIIDEWIKNVWFFHPCKFSTSLFLNKYIFKCTIDCFPEFYLTFEISAFDSHSYHRHHIQTSEVSNSAFKQLSQVLFQARNLGFSAHLNHANIDTGFY